MAGEPGGYGAPTAGGMTQFRERELRISGREDALKRLKVILHGSHEWGNARARRAL